MKATAGLIIVSAVFAAHFLYILLFVDPDSASDSVVILF